MLFRSRHDAGRRDAELRHPHAEHPVHHGQVREDGPLPSDGDRVPDQRPRDDRPLAPHRAARRADVLAGGSHQPRRAGRHLLLDVVGREDVLQQAAGGIGGALDLITKAKAAGLDSSTIGNLLKNFGSPGTTQIENTAQPGEEAYGWQYFSDGTAISPDGTYYYQGEQVYTPDSNTTVEP